MHALARRHLRMLVAAAALSAAIATQGCGGSTGSSSASATGPGASSPAATPSAPRQGRGASGPIEIRTLSNRADLVSGGDALVELVMPMPAVPHSLRVKLNGKDVSDAFAPRPTAGGRVLGLLTGLSLENDGRNVLTATIGNSHGGKLVITNHPIGGPVIAGPQTQPFVCATPTPQAATATSPATNASGLSTFAIDAQCNIATEVKFFYRTTTAGCKTSLPDPSPAGSPPPVNNCFKPFTSGDPMPADLATTTTDQGVRVPYIVRVERGTIDRGIFDVAVLFDPSQDWKPWAPQSAWNRKVVYSFGASTGQPRRQFRSEQNWADDAALSRGFMVADNSMTDSLFDSNRVYNAEALMMMKEHIIETYGEIRYVIGNGCSGGSIQQLTAASIFPGLVDGIQPTCTYPDSETTSLEVGDCVLLVSYFDSPAFKALVGGLSQAQIDAKKTAIAGHLDRTGCMAWNNLFGNIGRPGQFVPKLVVDTATGALAPVGAPRNNCQLLASQVYDPVTNADGTRCGGADNAISIFGPTAGKPNRGRTTIDNVGVQYGLAALASGAITPEDFVTLNEKIGGFDEDANLSPDRTIASPDALSIAYTSGIVSAGQLARTPIIDVRGFDDSMPPLGPFGIHHIWRSFALRARLDRANGNHDNLVLWRVPTPLLAPPQVTLQSFLTMDAWLANVEADTSDLPRAQKVANDKPASASDFCYLSSDPTFSNKVTDEAVCDADPLLARHASPRQIAGGPLAEDVLKCQLKPLDFNDPAYGGAVFTDAQKARLSAVFASGVCDWTKPGANQVPFDGPLTFEAGPGGEPLGPAPVSTGL